MIPIPEHDTPPAADPAPPGPGATSSSSAAGMPRPADFTLSRDNFGRLLLSRTGRPDVIVTPVRSFPISAPDESISLVDAQAQEQAWVDRLQDLPETPQRLIAEDLAQRDFKPEILRIHRASGWATPSRWDVVTDRGPAVLTLKSEDDIRRLSANTLLIADACGVHFLVRDLAALDRASRKILDRFL
ncbi:DUF1854 domain-containing protein [uncultured Castellaniella sp.]|uniref:cyanophycin metabolism-associated DUF1854 family protein n=1 Tax=uncultured Castellaniella sp. TaxID=647907 RepID=UPI003436CAA3